MVFVTMSVCILTCQSNSSCQIFPQVDMHDMYPPTDLQHNEYACHSSQRQEACQWYVTWKTGIKCVQLNVTQ